MRVSTGEATRSWRSSDDQIDEAIGHKNHLANEAAVEEPCHVLIPERGISCGVFTGPARHGEAGPDAAVHLDDDLDGFGTRALGIERGPEGCFEQALLVAETLPEFFRDVRRERGDERDERLDLRPRRRTSALITRGKAD
jgi:hypothetical protein